MKHYFYGGLLCFSTIHTAHIIESDLRDLSLQLNALADQVEVRGVVSNPVGRTLSQKVRDWLWPAQEPLASERSVSIEPSTSTAKRPATTVSTKNRYLRGETTGISSEIGPGGATVLTAKTSPIWGEEAEPSERRDKIVEAWLSPPSRNNNDLKHNRLYAEIEKKLSELTEWFRARLSASAFARVREEIKGVGKPLRSLAWDSRERVESFERDASLPQELKKVVEGYQKKFKILPDAIQNILNKWKVDPLRMLEGDELSNFYIAVLNAYKKQVCAEYQIECS